MHTVSIPGLPSSYQLSGWTTSSGTLANGIIGPIDVSGWISGPSWLYSPSDRLNQTRNPRGRLVAVPLFPADSSPR